MVVVLNVAEKPSVAKEVANILSTGKPWYRQGKSKYNGLYDFEYEIEGQKCSMVVTSVSGHLLAVGFEAKYKIWSDNPPEELFSAPIQRYVPESSKKIVATLKQEAARADWLVLWLDCDREGENICYEVISVCKQVNKNLRVLRANFSALIPRDIHHACQTLRQPNKHFSEAVDARIEIDLRIGSAFTRFQSLLLQRQFAGLPSPISYGPCQFPTLGFVVDRHLEIERFIPEQYWNIDSTYTHEDKTAKFTWQRGPLYERMSCRILYQLCCEAPIATVSAVDKRMKRKWKPLPLSTIAFQKLAAQKLKLSSHVAMKSAEALYVKGFISYPRTETDLFVPGTDLSSLVQLQTGHPAWGAYATALKNGDFEKPRDGPHNDHAHPPIHPTKLARPNQLSGNDAKVYELVTRHFLACCSKDAIGDETKVSIDIAGERFNVSGLIVRERNFLDVYPYLGWGGEGLPSFTLGQSFVPTNLLMREEVTVPPRHLLEEELITLMDKNGIGTDATISQHIETILKRQYAFKNELRFHPTDLGLVLIQGYSDMNLDLSKPRLRAEMEHGMLEVSEGRLSKDAFVNTTLAKMQDVFSSVCHRSNILKNAVSQKFSHT